jgi:hypothetical protein
MHYQTKRRFTERKHQNPEIESLNEQNRALKTATTS